MLTLRHLYVMLLLCTTFWLMCNFHLQQTKERSHHQVLGAMDCEWNQHLEGMLHISHRYFYTSNSCIKIAIDNCSSSLCSQINRSAVFETGTTPNLCKGSLTIYTKMQIIRKSKALIYWIFFNNCSNDALPRTLFVDTVNSIPAKWK